MIKWILIFLCVIVSFKLVLADRNLKLIFVQILFRHGDRAPLTIYPNDPNPESVWPEGIGQLTMMGKKQQYNLGKFFRNFYKDFMTSSPLEVNVTSAPSDRCLRSAQINLASFYEPSEDWKFDKNLAWQPISVRYLPENEDLFLTGTSYCPKADAEKLRVANSKEGYDFNAKHQKMYDYVSKHSGSPIKNWLDATYLCDNIFVEKIHNLTVPDWIEPYWEELIEVKDLTYFWVFNSPLIQRLRAGPLVQQMIEMMDDKIKGKIPKLKFQLYSSHDTALAVVLTVLNVYDFKQPPYCATILIELYSGLNNTYFVRFLYLNSTEPGSLTQTPHVLLLDGCTEYCSLEYVKEYTKHLMSDDWKRDCGISDSELEKFAREEVKLGLVFLAVIFIIVTVSFVVAVIRMYSSRKGKKSLPISIPAI